MKKEFVYSLEKDDGFVLSIRILEQVYNMMRGFVLPEEEDRESPHPGIKALRKIRGNLFTAEDVQAYKDYFDELLQRSEANTAELREERDRIAADDTSRKAYDGLIGNIEDGRVLAKRDMDLFFEEFSAAAQEVSPPSVRL